MQASLKKEAKRRQLVLRFKSRTEANTKTKLLPMLSISLPRIPLNFVCQ